MRLNEVTYTGGLPIEGYGPGFFRVAGQQHAAPFAVMPSGIVDWAGWEDTEPILSRADEVDVLFVGTGPEIAHLPAAFRDAMDAAGIGVEVAASPPACRTYNVLLGEGRRVGIALMPV